MRIKTLSTLNYRTLEALSIALPEYYTAVCGKNDSGKSNVVKAIRTIVTDQDVYYSFEDEPDFSAKDDFTKWCDPKAKGASFSISLDFEIDKSRDEGLYQFLAEYLKIKNDNEERLSLEASLVVNLDNPKVQQTVRTTGKEFTGIKAEEVLKKLRSSRAILFHNSVSPRSRYVFNRPYFGTMAEVSDDNRKQVELLKNYITKGMKRIARSQQKAIESLIGRLESKYTVGLSLPSYNFEDFPYGISLGDKKIDVTLDEWGSGTQNRTRILMTLLRAKQISESTLSASKVTPVIVIEEPESFLHPSAQAKFGRVLQDLASEFKVQVIVTSHSPYMLSRASPTSNILLERKTVKGKQRATVVAETSGESWMRPFALSLGLDKAEFQPWKELLIGSSECVLLVEGEIDKEYFELLRQDNLGENRLILEGEVFPYNGKDNLKNFTLLSYVKNRCDKIFITYDLDADEDLRPDTRATRLSTKQGLLADRQGFVRATEHRRACPRFDYSGCLC